MKPKQYHKLVNTTIIYYVFLTVYDLVTSAVLLAKGHPELNPLYGILGFHYWTFYIVVSVAFPILLLEFGNRWAFLCMWGPSTTHTLAIINNQILLFGA